MLFIRYLGILHAAGFAFLCHHYDMPLESAYDLTVKELQIAGIKTGWGYVGINLIIYVFGYIALIAFNCALAYMVKHNKN